jgi:DNA-binding response OmpR family regulator
MIEDVTTALQAFASTGNGFTLTLRDARFLTFKVSDIGFKPDRNVVDVVVRRLRAVDDPFETKLIHTIYGVGYVLKAHVSC